MASGKVCETQVQNGEMRAEGRGGPREQGLEEKAELMSDLDVSTWWNEQ